MGRPATDLVGRRFEKLLVLHVDGRAVNKHVKWRCRCDCGNYCVVRGDSLCRGDTTSCGCVRLETMRAFAPIAGATHGKSRTAEYKTWARMIARCENEHTTGYRYYGGRGIKVWPQWRNNFSLFYEYAGQKPTPKHSIDRIDVNGNYEPGNVRWATQSEQLRNRRKYTRHA